MVPKDISVWSILALIILVFYFFNNDIDLYQTVQNESNLNINITVKAVMLDHVNAYLLQPLTHRFVELTSLPRLFPWLTANHVSFIGLGFAFLAARLVLNDQLAVRRLAVIAFFTRQFMDDLDGYIARFHLGIDTSKQVSLTHSSGYIVDGICDGIGTIVFWIALLRWACYYRSGSGSTTNNSEQSKCYTLMEDSPSYVSQYSLAAKPSNNREQIVKHYILLLTQIGLSSLFWNLFLNQYHQVLDPSVDNGFNFRTPLQEEIFKSSLMFLIMWMWRCLNPHALTNYLLVSIWINRPTQFVRWSNRYAFYIILALAFLSAVHLNDVKYRLSEVSYTPTIQ